MMNVVTRTTLPLRSRAWRSALAVALVCALGGAMLPLRAHLSVTTTALILVVPVVTSVAVGGFGAGLVATAAGFLVYDFIFIPPYYTLTVGAAQNWVALGVYVVVMVVVARVVAQANSARAEAQARERELRRLFDVSELLVRDSSAALLLNTIVTSVLQAFDLDGAALLLPVAGRLRVAASAGQPLTHAEQLRFSTRAGTPVSVDGATSGSGALQPVALSASGDPIGLLLLRWRHRGPRDRELLRAFANHLALALERAQLREQALRAELLEEVDRLRRSLVGAVSHDLRTPLATIKVAATTLLDSGPGMDPADSKELLSLVDGQADRLDRLVSNLLDMTRIQSGALDLRRQATGLDALVGDALAALGPGADPARIVWEPAERLPLVEVDPVLIRQVLVNLMDNAIRYAPDGTAVTVSAATGGDGTVTVTVADHGPGVGRVQLASVYEMFNRREAGGGGGLGLAIASAFVEAHGQRLWLDEGYSPGARFAFSLPVARTTP